MAENQTEPPHVQSSDVKTSSLHMVSMLSAITSVFGKAIKSAFPAIADQVPASVSPASQEKFGDYQCNSAMTIAQVTDVIFVSCYGW